MKQTILPVLPNFNFRKAQLKLQIRWSSPSLKTVLKSSQLHTLYIFLKLKKLTLIYLHISVDGLVTKRNHCKISYHSKRMNSEILFEYPRMQFIRISLRLCLLIRFGEWAPSYPNQFSRPYCNIFLFWLPLLMRPPAIKSMTSWVTNGVTIKEGFHWMLVQIFNSITRTVIHNTN